MAHGGLLLLRYGCCGQTSTADGTFNFCNGSARALRANSSCRSMAARRSLGSSVAILRSLYGLSFIVIIMAMIIHRQNIDVEL